MDLAQPQTSFLKDVPTPQALRGQSRASIFAALELPSAWDVLSVLAKKVARRTERDSSLGCFLAGFHAEYQGVLLLLLQYA